MSLALRIFIVLNLVMTLGFMYIQMNQFATKTNWKQRWDTDTRETAAQLKLSNQVVASETVKAANAVAQVTVAEASLTAERAKVRELQGKIDENEARIKSLDANIAKAQDSYNRLKEDFQTQSTSLDTLRKSNNERASIAQVARAVAFNLNVKLAEVEDDLNNLQTEYAKRSEELAKKTAEQRDAIALIAQVREKFPEAYNAVKDEKGTSQALRAQVSAVRDNQQGKQEFVMLSIGKDDAVSEGLEFTVYRGNDYICKVRVEKVMNDLAPARIIAASWNTKGLKVQEGDLASNRL